MFCLMQPAVTPTFTAFTISRLTYSGLRSTHKYIERRPDVVDGLAFICLSNQARTMLLYESDPSFI